MQSARDRLHEKAGGRDERRRCCRTRKAIEGVVGAQNEFIRGALSTTNEEHRGDSRGSCQRNHVTNNREGDMLISRFEN